MHQRFANFGDVVGRDARGHTDGNSLRTIYQQVREFTGENHWFGAGIVVVWLHIDGVKIDIVQHFRRCLPHAGLGVSHRCRWVTINRTKITLRFNQRISH